MPSSPTSRRNFLAQSAVAVGVLSLAALRGQTGTPAPTPIAAGLTSKRRTAVSIDCDRFLINGEPTYKGRSFRGQKIEGLLLNSRMVQGLFDDANPETVSRWAYPDTGRWDCERNTREFLSAMPIWRAHGLLSFTINLQGGSPEGYSKAQPWINSAFGPDGSPKADYFSRLKRILDFADELGMVVIVGYFYNAQARRFTNEASAWRVIEETTAWLLDKGYTNVLVEIANETSASFPFKFLQPEGAEESIRRAQSIVRQGRRLLVGISHLGNRLPTDAVIGASDFVLIHGNGVKIPDRIREMVRLVRGSPSWKAKPILFNEDDHFDFEQPDNNFLGAISEYASWGYFDPGKNDYADGYQCPPVNWGLSSPRKQAFFSLVKEMSGA